MTGATPLHYVILHHLLLPLLALLHLAQTQVLGVDLVLLGAVEHLVSANIKSRKLLINLILINLSIITWW